MLANITSHLNTAIINDQNGVTNPLKMMLYVGHQDTLTPLTALFNYVYPNMLPFATTTFFELYKGSKGYYVKVRYNSNVTLGQTEWPIASFNKYINSVIYKDFYSACMNTNPFGLKTAVWLCIGIEIALVLLSITMITILSKQRAHPNSIKIYYN